MVLLRLLFLSIALFPLGMATAAVVNYDENVDGDIGDFFYGSQPQFTFDIGANTISGNTGWDGWNPADNDEFEFIIPTGTQLSSISYAFGNVNSKSGTTSLGISLINPFTTGTVDVYVMDTYTPDTSPVALYTSTLPIGEGAYDWKNQYFFTSVDGGGAWDYTITFNVDVSAVPIPGAIWLFGSGLLGFIGMAQRKKARHL